MRRVTLEVGGRRWRARIDDAVRLSIPLDFDDAQPKAFGLPEAAAEPIVFDDTVSDTERGGPFNCQSLRFIPHGNGTHTESAGHVVSQEIAVGELVREALLPSTVLTVEPSVLGEVDETYTRAGKPDDAVITREALASRASALGLPEGFLRGLVIRTSPNDIEKRQRDYSGTNPPYLTVEAVDWVREQGVEHLLVDTPSIDREKDGGALANHRAFWGIEEDAATRPVGRRGTITEMIFVPDSVPDAVYFLNIQVPDFASDAAPSRPLLYEAVSAK